MGLNFTKGSISGGRYTVIVAVVHESEYPENTV